jgi:hypothetical protein
LKRLGLDFYPADFRLFKETFNPIVLLGRWNTILNQANLKQSDLKAQWLELTKPEYIHLTKSYGSIRAITDYLNTEYPCGFIIHEMFTSRDDYNHSSKYSFMCSVESCKINEQRSFNEQEFWIFIAYQQNRNSIQFYREALKSINSMDIYGESREKMRRLLAASTTGFAHTAKNEADETFEQETWSKLCELADTISTASLALRAFALQNGEHRCKSDFIEHLTRLDETPNIPFLCSMADRIKDYLSDVSIVGVGISQVSRYNPLEDLVRLSNKLNTVVREFKADFYAGAQFYFIQGKWNTLDVQKYTELLFELHYKYISSTKLIVPYISTFNITSIFFVPYYQQQTIK